MTLSRKFVFIFYFFLFKNGNCFTPQVQYQKAFKILCTINSVPIYIMMYMYLQHSFMNGFGVPDCILNVNRQLR